MAALAGLSAHPCGRLGSRNLAKAIYIRTIYKIDFLYPDG